MELGDSAFGTVSGNEGRALKIGTSAFGKHPRTSVKVYGCHTSTREVEIVGSRLQGSPQLHSEFETSMGYMKTLFQKRNKQRNMIPSSSREKMALEEEAGLH